jgi:DNA-binding NtrC family response regulator
MGTSTALLVGSPTSTPTLRTALAREAFDVVEGPRLCETGAAWHRCRAAVAVIACGLDDQLQALEVARALHASDPRLPIVFVTEVSSEELVIAALKAGVVDYCRGTIDPPAVAAAARAAAGAAMQEPRSAPAPPTMVGTSPTIGLVRAYLERVGASDVNVLITGETGTGKELAAQLLHSHSNRRRRAFVSVNCAAIPDGLLESELFGYERGAFTGANTARDGHFRAAEGGSLLLDEIGEMTPFAQAKILRALDTREIYRLGSTRKLPLDVRVIAATNQNLDALMEEGRFRRDLYYRLNVARVRLPPLRERREDIPALLDHYIHELNGRFQRSVAGFTSEAMRELVAYDWPGNVREVKNLLEAAFAEMPNRSLGFIELPAALRERVRALRHAAPTERDLLLDALRATNWNKSLAAQRLRWSRMTLYRKLAKYALITPERHD